MLVLRIISSEIVLKIRLKLQKIKITALKMKKYLKLLLGLLSAVYKAINNIKRVNPQKLAQYNAVTDCAKIFKVNTECDVYSGIHLATILNTYRLINMSDNKLKIMSSLSCLYQCD